MQHSLNDINSDQHLNWSDRVSRSLRSSTTSRWPASLCRLPAI